MAYAHSLVFEYLFVYHLEKGRMMVNAFISNNPIFDMTKKKNGRSLKLVGKLTRLVKARVNEEEYTLICNF